MKMVTFYHDIEQDVNVEADGEACREAVRSLLALEASHDVRTTYNVVGALWRDQPDIVEWIRDGRHEVAFHSYNHRIECRPDEFRDEVRLCREHSLDPVGYRSPRSRWNSDTLQSLKEHGFAWNAESDAASRPYFICPALARLPIAGDDWPVHLGVVGLNDWVDGFRRHLAAREYVAIGVHDCVVSHEPTARLGAWEHCLEIALEEGAQIVTFGKAARCLDEQGEAGD